MDAGHIILGVLLVIAVGTIYAAARWLDAEQAAHAKTKQRHQACHAAAVEALSKAVRDRNVARLYFQRAQMHIAALQSQVEDEQVGRFMAEVEAWGSEQS